MNVSRLRRLVRRYKHYAVIESEELFGHFFNFVGFPNDSFTVVLAKNKRDAVKRYAKRYNLKHNHYPEFYIKGAFLRECSMRFGRYCVIQQNKQQTFYRM